jgi:hypothetical protein
LRERYDVRSVYVSRRIGLLDGFLNHGSSSKLGGPMNAIRRFNRSRWTMLAMASALASSMACNADWLDAPGAAVFFVNLTPSTLPLVQGQSKSIDLTVGWTGSANPRVELSVDGMPSGVTATFSSTSLSAGATTSSLSIKTGLNVPLQTFTIIVRARAKDYDDGTAQLSATVTAAP